MNLKLLSNLVAAIANWTELIQSFYKKVKNEVEKEEDENKRKDLLEAIEKRDIDTLRRLLFDL